MYKILLLTFIVILVSCRPTTKPTGIWQLAYLTSPKGINSVPTTRTIFDFQDDSLKVIDFENPFTDERKSLYITNYRTEIRDNNLLFTEKDKTMKFEIKNYSGDSLVLFSDSLSERITLKRLTKIDGKKIVKSDLIDKSFTFSVGPKYLQKLDFVNDSIVLYGSDYRPQNWNIVSYKDYDFLNINYPFFGLFFINRNDQGSIIIRGNFTKPIEYELQPEIKANESKDLIGNWIEYERSLNPPILFDFDTLEQLNISTEILEFSRFGRQVKRSWYLTNDGQAIYFRHKNDYHFERILELTDSTLVLRKHSSDSLTVKYMKQVICAQSPIGL